MGFTSVWITPIVDNPDEAFTGGTALAARASSPTRARPAMRLLGREFLQVDERLPSPGLDFKDLADAVHGKGMKLVLDIVGNHGSPAWDMAYDQPKFGKLYDKDGTLIADHQNLPPQRADPAHNPLHRFYNTVGPVDGAKGSIFDGSLAQLSDLNERNPRCWTTWPAPTSSGSIRARTRSASTPSPGCPDSFLAGLHHPHPRKHPGFSCSARPSTTTLPRSPPTPCPATAKPACWTSR